ncbi:unnamed protein product [Kuraishia capsulata CBS 1993]|uniref:tRNA-binding domain-containing protein n=1 Tax=Kuraishia capsulata CBS 1993 TaxID=1382522 RepID=W6MNA0_9ASCO|nr:uncharacterized protein KUCA_T00004110001 [Kuraishia capsulata CBS 1993]CDK28129.1 unnamed protein product [Kuraishia capsulata CBS 1993]
MLARGLRLFIPVSRCSSSFRLASGTAKSAESKPSALSPSLLNLKVGQIVDIKQHENADSLYVSKIQINEAIPPTILQVCSGLVNYVPMETLRGMRVALVMNLKPSKMRGEVSEAMLLAAEKIVDGKTLVEPVLAPSVELGSRLRFESGTAEEPPRIKPKNLPLIFQNVRTDSEGVVVYVDENGVTHSLKTDSGEMARVKRLFDAGVR